MDYASLRQEGLRWLERLSGGEWTDFNEHDPGITILEQLCYAISDLSYRIGHRIPDLLAEGGADPYGSLPPAEAILTSAPVTAEDLRRVVLDVEGVRNAWVEPVVEDGDGTVLAFLRPTHELRTAAKAETLRESAALQKRYVRGLYRVHIESTDPEDKAVRTRVMQRLEQSRGLCEDLAEVSVLGIRDIGVLATVEIDAVDDPSALLLQICRALDEEISPPVHSSSLAALLAAGGQIDEILQGPHLRRGFLSHAALNAASRRSSIYTSDLMHAIMNVKGVRAVSRIAIANAGACEPWCLAITPDSVVARFSVSSSKIVLRRLGKTLWQKQPEARELAVSAPPRPKSGTLMPPAARNRSVHTYTSVQQQLPSLYGVGAQRRSGAAVLARRAQALQLKAYLLFFDQLLANSFAQLAGVKDLFSFSAAGPNRTRFSQRVSGEELGLDQIYGASQSEDAQKGIEDQSADTLARKHRFLNHLLARFAEPVGEHAQTASPKDRASYKQSLLEQYAESSRRRGTGVNLLAPGDGKSCGYKSRLGLTTGIFKDHCAEILVVEHILLRPLPEDLALREQEAGKGLVLFAAPRSEDPYSMQVTLVLAEGQGPFHDDGQNGAHEHKEIFERAVRSETPAHIVPYVHWLGPAAFAEFQRTYFAWQRLLSEYRLMDASGDKAAANGSSRSLTALKLRGSRDRIIDLLQLGETYPLVDTQVTAQYEKVIFGARPILLVTPSQVGVRYTLYSRGAVVSPSVEGTGETIAITGPVMNEARSFRVFAEKIDHPQRRLFLDESVTISVGVRTDLPVTFLPADASPPFAAGRREVFQLIDYGRSVVVLIRDSQSGISYELVDQRRYETDKQNASLAKKTDHGSSAGVLGNGGEIRLESIELTEDVVIGIRARRSVSGQLQSDDALDTKLSVAVRANPRLRVEARESIFADFASTATLTIDRSQSTVLYSAQIRRLSDLDFLLEAPKSTQILTATVPGEPDVMVLDPRASGWPAQTDSGLPANGTVAGRDGEVELVVGPIMDDCVVVVTAVKDHSAVIDIQMDREWLAPRQSRIPLTQAVLILARPQPVPAMSLQLQPDEPGSPPRLLVAGGEPGVLYRFYIQANDHEIGAAYFHKTQVNDSSVNRGLELLRIENDFIIPRDPVRDRGAAPLDLSRQRPPDPELYLSALPAEPTLFVMARKLRTGVTWTSLRAFPLRGPWQP